MRWPRTSESTERSRIGEIRRGTVSQARRPRLLLMTYSAGVP